MMAPQLRLKIAPLIAPARPTEVDGGVGHLGQPSLERGCRILFPLPIDLIQMLLEGRSSTTGQDAEAPKNRKVPWPPTAA